MGIYSQQGELGLVDGNSLRGKRTKEDMAEQLTGIPAKGRPRWSDAQGAMKGPDDGCFWIPRHSEGETKC